MCKIHTEKTHVESLVIKVHKHSKPWNDKVPRSVVKITGMFTSTHPTLFSYLGSNIAVNKLCALSLENANPKERKGCNIIITLATIQNLKKFIKVTISQFSNDGGDPCLKHLDSNECCCKKQIK